MMEQTVTGRELLRFLQECSEEELKQAVDCTPDQYGNGYVIWLGNAGLSVSPEVDDDAFPTPAEVDAWRGRVCFELETEKAEAPK